MLPGPKWNTSLQAKTWLIEQRRLLEWSHKDVANAFFDCAVRSDLRQEREGAEYHSRLFHLGDDEIALVTRCREMDADERGFLRFVAELKMLR